MPANGHGTIMRCLRGSWALGVVAPWCLGIALAVSITADAGEGVSSGSSIAPLAWRTQSPPTELIPAQPSALGIDFGSFTGEAQQILRQASLSIGTSEEFKRLPDEVEPRAELKRNAQHFPEIDRSHRGDPFTGLRPAFDTRLRNFPGLARFRAADLIFHHDDVEPASSFSVSEEALGPESVAAFEPWLDGESPTTAQSRAEVSPPQAASPETVRPAALNERLMQGATPAILRAIALGSATPAPADSTPIEIAAVSGNSRGYLVHGEGYARLRPNYAALIDQDTAMREKRCLAEAIYFEARGEPKEGQAAVAQIVLNRASSGLYPPTICGVVYQNRRHYNACQFSFACGGKALRITQPDAWREAQRIAAEVTNGSAYLSDIGSSTHFHANYVRPRWARRLEKMDVIGHHIFYKLKPGQS
jgi:spore germination cell wall hydrolase CwlJ-like protein